jgi:hypothetical protein
MVSSIPVTTWSLEEAVASHGAISVFLARDTAIRAGKIRSPGWFPRVGSVIGGIRGALTNVQGGNRVKP